MAKALVIVSWCDICASHEMKVEGITYTATVDGAAREIELCTDHYNEYMAPWAEVLAAFGREPAPPRPGPRWTVDAPSGRRPYRMDTSQNVPDGQIVVNADGRLVCPRCGADSANRAALGSHGRRMHNATLTELAGRERTDRLACGVCGQPFIGSLGMHTHLRKAHGITDSVERAALVGSSRAGGD